MAEQYENVNELLKKVRVFEDTIKELLGNVKKFKKKLTDNKKKFGPDTSKWPVTEK